VKRRERRAASTPDLISAMWIGFNSFSVDGFLVACQDEVALCPPVAGLADFQPQRFSLVCASSPVWMSLGNRRWSVFTSFRAIERP